MSTDEPVLRMEEIQGIVVPGFSKPRQALIHVWLGGTAEICARARAALADKARAGVFTSAAAALRDRRDVRPPTVALGGRREHRRQVLQARRAGGGEARAPLVAVAFTATGLSRLGDAGRALLERMPGAAFRLGLARRAGLLGDYASPADAGHPSQWVIGAPGKEPDALIVIAGDDDARLCVQERAQAWVDELSALGARASIQWGNAREDLPGFEHFGFKDGISQPGIRGRASAAPEDYLTERHLPRDDPEREYFGYPGQHLVWPGEFVFGYPASSPDPLIPGPPRDASDGLRDGSFLVFRRLRQDVTAFEAAMEREARDLRGRPGFEHMSAPLLKAMLVGRWPSGAPVSRAPLGDRVDLGRDPLANNDFRFDDDSPPRRFEHAPTPAFPLAKADIVGLVCPVAAHVRKVNLRDQASDVGGASATQTRRLLRVGVPYDDSRSAPGAAAAVDDRGLLFMSIQASIEDQFEFLQARWINSASRPRGPGGHDMVVGQNAVAKGGVRQCHLFGRDMHQTQLSISTQFVTATGGGYYFVPSLSALKRILGDGTRGSCAGGDGSSPRAKGDTPPDRHPPARESSPGA